MEIRPSIKEIKSGLEFYQYYFLLSELKEYCRDNSLPLSGSKQELSKRIAHYIDTAEILSPVIKKQPTKAPHTITEDSFIEENIICTETHRAFFKNQIGKGFTFNVLFQEWLKKNSGKTYREAITAYLEIKEQLKTQKTTISSQFEYNTYIRDFMADNPSHKLKDAIECWYYKKSKAGHNRYEKEDLLLGKVIE